MGKLQTIPEMSEALTQHKSRDGYTGKIYKAQADEHKGDVLTADLEHSISEMQKADRRGPIDWNDLEQVKSRTYDYLTACATSQVFPSMMGLSIYGYGMSRQAVNKYLVKYPDSPAAKFVSMAKDLIADTLTNAALFRNADPVSVIFQLKNHFNHYDKLQVEPVPQNTDLLAPVTDPEERKRRIMERYADLIVDEE